MTYFYSLDDSLHWNRPIFLPPNILPCFHGPLLLADLLGVDDHMAVWVTDRADKVGGLGSDLSHSASRHPSGPVRRVVASCPHAVSYSGVDRETGRSRLFSRISCRCGPVHRISEAASLRYVVTSWLYWNRFGDNDEDEVLRRCSLFSTLVEFSKRWTTNGRTTSNI